MTTDHKHRALPLSMLVATLAAVLVAGAATTAHAEEPRIAVIADPQLHNVYGLAVKQGTKFSNLASKVSIRPAELNLLAPLWLADASRQAVNAGDPAMPLLILGDATNVGCDGEWDMFTAALPKDRLWLAAHGNHDTYLSGTINYLMPTDHVRSPLTRTLASDVPQDESWWIATDAAISKRSGLSKRNWADACYRPGPAETGYPMNKPRWMARYAKHLEPFGLSLEAAADGGKDDGIPLTGVVAPGSQLAAIGYQVRGRWWRPEPQHKAGGKPQFYYPPSWGSYLVQSFLAGDRHTVVLIDSSACQVAKASLSSNAGSNACIGARQMADIKQVLDGIAPTRRVVMAAHFPLGKLSAQERACLGAMLATRSAGASFLSGHTHEALNQRWNQVNPKRVGTAGCPVGAAQVEKNAFAFVGDFNVGSTTDWPMEANVVRLADTGAVVRVDRVIRLGSETPPRWTYGAATANHDRSELCRHYVAAERLQEAIDPARRTSTWATPEAGKSRCDALELKANQEGEEIWAASARQLHGMREEIAQAYAKDAGYREYLRSIAVGASYKESLDWDFVKLEEVRGGGR